MNSENSQNFSDQRLVADYLGGEESALEILIKRYLKPIYSFVFRYIGGGREAEDITQEIFFRVWKNLKKFDQQKSFKTWIFSIAKNASIDWLKKKKASPFSEFENEENENALTNVIADPAPLTSEFLERQDITQMLSLAMEKISPQYRMVLFMRYNDHFTFREMAESLEEPLHTVKGRHRRALIILKRLLSQSP